MSSNNENGWNEYSNLVLRELETLGRGINELNTSLQEVKQQIAVIRTRDNKIQELDAWKSRIDDVVSPTQLKDLKKEVDELKLFKTKAVTIFAVIQFGMGFALFFDKLF
jgi:uncharacterized phage infection (PIP) family protein YhgE